ncbi:DUF882 domain-containing protein [Methylobacterium gnaphalii]|nr:DUF882 domain-containing protein [Methylobacterium gnaphalii]
MMAFAAVMLAGTVETENAVANGDTRTLSLIHEHTKESITVTFKRDGRYDKAALDQLNWLLRDWREAESIKMDPRLFDVVWEAQRSIGSTQPLRVVCGYRSPKTNGMLRRRSRGVAEHSQHTLGKAMDFFMTDASIDDIRAAGVRLQRGGVGWYPRSGSPFVHLDVGSVRAWPRMTHDQLARIFPDGKTVHLPANGKPFPRYEEARAEILARGGTVLGYTAVASADAMDDGPSLKGFFAGLFGGSDSAASTPAATPGKARGKATIAVASADPNDATGARQALAYAAPNSTDTLRNAMLRREGSDTPSAKALLTAEKTEQTSNEGSARVAPLPPRRPAEFAALAAAIAAPLPPGRAVQVAGIGNAGLANFALGTGPVTSAAFHLLPAEADARDHLRALFSTQAQGASEPARRDVPIRLAAIQSKPDEAPEDIFAVDAVATQFSARSPGDDLAATHFSGSALGN